jgi:hypothetical protein
VNKIIIASCVLLLAGCASEPPTVGYGTPRSVFVRIGWSDLGTEAFKVAEAYCAKYDRHERFSYMANPGVAAFDCIQ